MFNKIAEQSFLNELKKIAKLSNFDKNVSFIEKISSDAFFDELQKIASTWTTMAASSGKILAKNHGVAEVIHSLHKDLPKLQSSPGYEASRAAWKAKTKNFAQYGLQPVPTGKIIPASEVFNSLSQTVKMPSFKKGMSYA